MDVDTEKMETRIGTVMLATDFLQSSRLALDFAAAFAHHFHAELVTLNVFEFGPHSQNVELISHVPCRERTDAERRLRAFTSGIDRLGISAKWALVEGLIPSGILEGISLHHADLLVIGTQGVHRGLSHLLIGSNTEALMLTSPCPTLTIGPHVHRGINLEPGFKRILHVSDFTVASAAAAPFAHSLAHDFSAQLEVFQVPADSVRNDTAQVHQSALD